MTTATPLQRVALAAYEVLAFVDERKWLERWAQAMSERAHKAVDLTKIHRHPKGVPVDPATGAGGGRFAPKYGMGSDEQAGQMAAIARKRGYTSAQDFIDYWRERGMSPGEYRAGLETLLEYDVLPMSAEQATALIASHPAWRSRPVWTIPNLLWRALGDADTATYDSAMAALRRLRGGRDEPYATIYDASDRGYALAVAEQVTPLDVARAATADDLALSFRRRPDLKALVAEITWNDYERAYDDVSSSAVPKVYDDTVRTHLMEIAPASNMAELDDALLPQGNLSRAAFGLGHGNVARLLERAGATFDDRLRYFRAAETVFTNAERVTFLSEGVKGEPWVAARPLLAQIDPYFQSFVLREYASSQPDMDEMTPGEAMRVWMAAQSLLTGNALGVVAELKDEFFASTVDSASGDPVDVGPMQETAHDLFALPNRHLGSADDDAAQKDAIAVRLSDVTGSSYDTANALVAQWAATANGDDMASLGVQQIAADVFDTELSAWQQERIAGNEYDPILFERELGRKDARTVITDLLYAMRDETQAWLAANGITHVRLYRGVWLPAETVGERGLGDAIRYDDNALSSWSLDFETALHFADPVRAPSAVRGVVLSASIPVEQVLSTARTGFGCLEEREFVVIGRKEPSHARIDYLT